MALSSGVDVKTLSSMLGHYSAGFTLDTYTHITNDMQRGCSGEDRRLHGNGHNSRALRDLPEEKRRFVAK